MAVITMRGLELQKWQKDFIKIYKQYKNSEQIITTVSPRQVGKTYVIQQLLLDQGINRKCNSILISPTNSLNDKVFTEMVALLCKSPIFESSNGSKLSITLKNGSVILFKSAEQRNALRGYTVSGILIIDEGAYIQDNIYSIINAYTNKYRRPTVIFSTPFMRNGEFYERYNKGLNNVKGYSSFTVSNYDLSFFRTEEKLEQVKLVTTKAQFKSEYLGEFVDDDMTLFPNLIFKDLEDTVPYYVGIDWANGGNDYTVLSVLNKSYQIVDVIAFKDKSPKEQVEFVNKYIKDNDPKKVIGETNSIGATFIDMLDRKISKFTTSNSSKIKIIEKMILKSEQNDLIFSNNISIKALVVEQFNNYAREILKTGYTYNGRQGHNDDIVMATAIALSLKGSANYMIR